MVMLCLPKWFYLCIHQFIIKINQVMLEKYMMRNCPKYNYNENAWVSAKNEYK